MNKFLSLFFSIVGFIIIVSSDKMEIGTIYIVGGFISALLIDILEELKK